MTSSSDDRAATSQLLNEVFPGTRVGDRDYLRWLYADNPDGEAFEANLDDEQGRAGHYSVTPCVIRERGRDVPSVLSLNSAVHERARGQGLFTTLGEQAYAKAVAQGREIVIGVGNANSTHGLVGRLRFDLVGPLPASVLLPLPGRGVPIADGLPSDDARLAEVLEAAAQQGEATVRWTSETLRWRVATPRANYAVHDGGDWVAVTTVERGSHVPVAIVLAVLAARPLRAAEAGALVRRACRHHRAPLALHVGHNDRLPVRGIALPDRLRPKPLNMVFRRLLGEGPVPRFGRFELLDFDAY
jgi:GNAT superfamily N-acetyltransferase